MDDAKQLEQLLGYEFSRRELLVEALTHRSWLNEAGPGEWVDNERLEFFGDALVDFMVSEYLLVRFPMAREGSLTKLRAELVSEPGLALVAEALGLGRFLRLGHGEELTGGRQKPSLLANAVEALVGALYLDGGPAAARSLLAAHLFPRVDAMRSDHAAGQDRKSALQELVQARQGVTPVYRVVDESGPPHRRLFEVAVLIDAEVVGTGCGSSKKAAEQAAAAVAFERLATLEHPEA